MRSISSIIIKLVALMTVLVLMPLQGLATTMDHTLTLGVISTKTTSLNPLVSQEREFQSLTALMYEGLYAIDDDYRPQKHLAEDCSVSNGGKTLTINIRSGVKFHNGKELTAYDVEATINEILRLANEGQGQYLQLKYFIASASANNGKTIIIKLNRAYYGNYYALTFPILPREEVQSTQPSGTGPYKLDRFVPKDYLYLSANENWWKEPPTVKNINVNFSATNKDLISDYEFNVLDAAITRSAAAGQYRTGLTNLNISYRTRQLETLLMCFNEFPLDDVRVRQAIRYAIDFDSIAASVYMGTAERTDTPIPSSIWLYNNAIQHEYNPDKARELLA
ncbi:MAG: ABC transporter substrate-binding protein, partial [Clostridiales bacterium]|nr:ABC transporter substrate-binding protein [Clostridiales bacterium]